MLKKRIKIKDSPSEDYFTDPTIPAIAKNMNCGANFEWKTSAYKGGKKLNKDEISRLYREIMDL
jgi:hypothetical protein